MSTIKKIVVTGGFGQLGQCLQEVSKNYPNLECTFLDVSDLDITNETAVASYFQQNSFDAIVNCAAYTAVDQAEKEPEIARKINATATQYLAKEANKYNKDFIHISTDYVFDGSANTPRVETDQVNPIGVYGVTKLEGEQMAFENNPKTIVIRTAWVYSPYANNFVKTMLRLFAEKEEIGVINDQIGSPTNALDLADVICKILSSSKEMEYGIYHYSNEGVCSWFEFAQKIKELTNSSIKINPLSTDEYPTLAKRPAYSLLDKTKIKSTFNIQIPEWTSSLEKTLKILTANT